MADVTIAYKGETIAEMDGTGTKTCKTAGTYCEGDIEVDYAPRCRTYEITLAKSSGWVLLTELDEDVLAHINDPLMTVVLAINDEYSLVSYTGSCFMATNTPFAYSAGSSGFPVYGYSHRQNGSGNTSSPIYYPPNNTGTSTSLGGSGTFRLDGNKYYIQPGDGYVRAGVYRLIFTW